LIVAPQALDDLAAIYAHIAETDVSIAARFVAELSDKMIWIAETGFCGVARDWLRPGLKALPFGNWCFYFRIDENSVYMLRVLHGKQDVEQQDLGDFHE
jgi:toxin ParE1/3/4